MFSCQENKHETKIETAQNVEMENKQYENFNLIKQIKAANEQINIIESKSNNKHFSRKDGPRCSDDMITCIMDFHGSDIPATTKFLM